MLQFSSTVVIGVLCEMKVKRTLLPQIIGYRKHGFRLNKG